MNHPNISLWASLFQLLDSYTFEDLFSAEKESRIIADMIHAGFKKDEAKAIFYWIRDLKQLMDEFKSPPKGLTASPKIKSIRVFTPEENTRFSPEAKDCLKGLEEAGIIDVNLREEIIDQAINLFDGTVEVADLRWVVFPLLFKGSNRISSEKQLLAILMLSGDKATKH